MTTQEKELVQLIDKKTEEDVSDELQIHIPASILNGSRKEIQETLKVLEGELPHDIHGHVFVVGPMAMVWSIALIFYRRILKRWRR